MNAHDSLFVPRAYIPASLHSHTKNTNTNTSPDTLLYSRTPDDIRNNTVKLSMANMPLGVASPSPGPSPSSNIYGQLQGRTPTTSAPHNALIFPNAPSGSSMHEAHLLDIRHH